MATALICVDIQRSFGTGALAGHIAQLAATVKPDYFFSVIYRTNGSRLGRRTFSKAHPLWEKTERQLIGLSSSSHEAETLLDILEELPPILRQQSTHLVSKKDLSAFRRTGLEELLPSLNINEVFIVGAYTNACVGATLEDAVKAPAIQKIVYFPDLVYLGFKKNGEQVLLSSDPESLHQLIIRAKSPKVEFRMSDPNKPFPKFPQLPLEGNVSLQKAIS